MHFDGGSRPPKAGTRIPGLSGAGAIIWRYVSPSSSSIQAEFGVTFCFAAGTQTSCEGKIVCACSGCSLFIVRCCSLFVVMSVVMSTGETHSVGGSMHKFKCESSASVEISKIHYFSGHATVMSSKKREIVWKGSKYIGERETNNTAEYEGLILGLRAAKTLGMAFPSSANLQRFSRGLDSLFFGRSKELADQGGLHARDKAAGWILGGAQAAP
jgi:hypothetical protein